MSQSTSARQQASEPVEPVQAALPCCGCGHDRNHFMVSPEPQYTFFDWFTVIFGITTVPYEVQFMCRACGVTFDRTTDQTEMQRVI